MRLLIVGSSQTHLVYTLDVSKHGVMLGGLHADLKIGDKIEVQYHHKRAQFRVVWIKSREGSKEKQVGAESLEPDKQLWDIEHSEKADEYEQEE